jgi:hypothetical protein
MQHVALLGGAYMPSTVVGQIDKTKQTADAEIAASITIVNNNKATAVNVNITVTVRSIAPSPAKTIVGTCTATTTLPAGGAGTNPTVTVMPKIKVSRVNLWSVNTPTLYEATVEVCTTIAATTTHNPILTTTKEMRSKTQKQNQKNTLTTTSSSTVTVCDAEVVLIGVRKTSWSATTGFHLNDVPTKILGAANHQDFAGVGVAVPDGLQVHRIAKLKEMGMNGWRTAHNAPTPALLDAADRIGFLVWDENHRNNQDDELTTLVLRDRNHPSVVIWSVCNEYLCETANTAADLKRSVRLFHTLDPMGGRVVRCAFADINLHSRMPLDPTHVRLKQTCVRPMAFLSGSPLLLLVDTVHSVQTLKVSANFNPINGPTSPLDVLGIDYATNTYDAVHALAPLKPSISSETSSAVNDRGEYKNVVGTGHVSGYDTNSPHWGEPVEGAWGVRCSSLFISQSLPSNHGTWIEGAWGVRCSLFRQRFILDGDGIGSHGCSLEALSCV